MTDLSVDNAMNDLSNAVPMQRIAVPSSHESLHTPSPVKLAALPGQGEDAALFRRPPFVELHLLVAQRLAGGAEHFQRPDDPPLVVRVQLRGQ